MFRSKTFHRKKILIIFMAVFFALLFLVGRLVYLMIFCSGYYGNKATDLHESTWEDYRCHRNGVSG